MGAFSAILKTDGLFAALVNNISSINSVNITNFTILGSLAGEALAPRPQHQARRHQGGPLYNVHGYVTT